MQVATVLDCGGLVDSRTYCLPPQGVNAASSARVVDSRQEVSGPSGPGSSPVMSIDIGTISSYSLGMRRRQGAVLPIEESVLRIAVATQGEFHGFEMAKELREIDDAKRLTAHGTLYKALSRMETAGLLESQWEDPQKAADEGRPRRRLYKITGAGEVALSRLDAARRAQPRHQQGYATS